jgi:hypothetical protein
MKQERLEQIVEIYLAYGPPSKMWIAELWKDGARIAKRWFPEDEKMEAMRWLVKTEADMGYRAGELSGLVTLKTVKG